jgi:hypothetical protein
VRPGDPQRGQGLHRFDRRRPGSLAEEHPQPKVRLRIRGGTFSGVARELREAAESQRARDAYCETVNTFDYAECRLHRKGRPTRSKISELHRTWFDGGIPLVVELSR